MVAGISSPETSTSQTPLCMSRLSTPALSQPLRGSAKPSQKSHANQIELRDPRIKSFPASRARLSRRSGEHSHTKCHHCRTLHLLPEFSESYLAPCQKKLRTHHTKRGSVVIAPSSFFVLANSKPACLTLRKKRRPEAGTIGNTLNRAFL